jgi:excisionase family DNA binding protein
LSITPRTSWNPTEFAERHGLSLSFIYQHIRDGLLNARKVGSRTIINESDERRWLKKLPPFSTHRCKPPKRKAPAELKDIA